MTSTFGEDGVSFVEQGEESFDMSIGEIWDAYTTPETVYGNIRYALALMGLDLRTWGGQTPNETRTTNGTETLIVPGYASRNCSFRDLRGSLERRDIHSHPLRDYEDLRLRKPFTAQESADLFQRRIEESPAQEVDVIGHSMGGPNILLGCQELRGKYRKKVRRIITLGSPFQGTQRAAQLGIFKRDDQALKDLSPGSDIVRRLSQVDEDIRQKVISIGSTHDGIVPWQSTILEGALMNAILRRKKAVTHANFLHNDDIGNTIAELLKIAA
jgi:pimeloyl-ACP methyl ester carboxylesterase